MPGLNFLAQLLLLLLMPSRLELTLPRLCRFPEEKSGYFGALTGTIGSHALAADPRKTSTSRAPQRDLTMKAASHARSSWASMRWPYSLAFQAVERTPNEISSRGPTAGIAGCAGQAKVRPAA